MRISKVHLLASIHEAETPTFPWRFTALILRSSFAPRALFSQISRFTTAVASLAVAGLILLSPSRSHADAGILPPLAAMGTPTTVLPMGQKYELKLHHLHTGESLDIVYRVGNTYIPSAIEKLNYFLRDHRTQDTSHYDPREFDLLHSIMEKVHKNEIDIVCGYRTPWSNNFLRTRSAVTGVAKNSQHVQAKAIDIKIPGVATRKLREIALSFHAGGVGYYPVSQFVHVDVGPVRQWTFAGRE
jgi:uncharacterized protein YcbK (DUF882 family)